MPSLLEKRLIFVTGKGGVGKSTVAVALGLVAARRGQRTIVAELASQERVQRLFGHGGEHFQESELAPGLFTISIDPQHAMDEYLKLKLGALGHALGSSRLFAVFAMATPGMRELLSIGKVWELAQRERRTTGAAAYDLVIVDAPATGHGVGLLRTPRTFADIARVGPIAHQAGTIAATIADRSVTGVVAAATPEEMPIAETLALKESLERDGLGLDLVVLNALYPERFADAELEDLRAALGQHPLPGGRIRAQGSALRARPRASPAGAGRAPAPGAQRKPRRAPLRVCRSIGRDRSPEAGRRTRQPVVSIASLLEGKRVCVCAGAGGVGKTTTSATIALGLAAQGAKVAVVTIDPAKRLANALGLESLDNEPHRVADELLASSGLAVQGELWAMMLDPKRTFDELIERLAPDPERAAQIKANRVYQELSTAVSGSQEFTAIAKLYELDREHDFDFLVLDTPPARNAVDFLDAPQRLSAFLEGRALKALTLPTGLGMRVLGRGATPLLGALRRVTGVDLVTDLGTFFELLAGMTADFSARARQVEALLRAPSTAFMLVTSAQGEPIDEAIWFHRTLRESGLPFSAVVVNRVHHDLIGVRQPRNVRRALDPLLPRDLAERVAQNFRDYHLLAARDERNLARLKDELGGAPTLLVPQLDDDVHDLAGLVQMHGYLFGSQRERDRLIAGVVA